MALFGLIGGNKPTPKNIEKQVNKVKERYAQQEFRRTAMEVLLDWGTPEALDGVLERFSVVVQSPHWDEEEKRWLVEEIAERRDDGRAALRRYIQSHNNIAFASKALRKVCTDEQFVQELVDALKARSPEDYRCVQAKQELVAGIADTENREALDTIVPYIDDHGDDVQCTAIDMVEKHKVETGYPRLVDIITNDMHPARVLRHAAGAVSRLGLPIDLEKPLCPEVTEDFVVKDGKLVSSR